MVIFHSYVSLPEGKSSLSKQFNGFLWTLHLPIGLPIGFVNAISLNTKELVGKNHSRMATLGKA